MNEVTRDEVLLISGDLILGSQLAGIAKAHDCQFVQKGSLDTGALPQVRLLVVDLSSPAANGLGQIVDEAQSAGVPVVAFGPHVQEQKLLRAKEAGCDSVVTRGSVVAEIKAMLSDSLPK